MDMRKKMYEIGGSLYAKLTGKEVATYEKSQPTKEASPISSQDKTADKGTDTTPATNGEAPPSESVPPEENPKPKKNLIKMALCAVIVLFLVVAAVMFLFPEKEPPTLNVADYMTFAMEPNGRNGHGRIIMKMDDYSFRNDLAQLFHVVINEHDFNLIKNGINITYSQEEALSNGDVVNIDVAYDLSAVPSRYSNQDGFNIVGKSGSFTVDGLSDAEFVDPFARELIDVKFAGNSGAATATIDIKSSAPYMSILNYTVMPNKGLKNGDVVTISIDPNVSRLSEMGYALPDPNDWTSEKTVSGLNELVSDPSTIPANVINSMVQFSEAKLNENFNAIKLDSMDQVVISPEISTIYFFDKVDKTSPYTNYFKNLEMVNGVFVLGHFFVQDMELVAPEAPEGGATEPIPTVVDTYGGYYVWIFPNIAQAPSGDFTYDRDMVCQWPTQNQTESDCLNWAKGEFTDFAVTSIGTNTN